MADTITVRKLDENYDPMYGQGAANFAADKYAVAQIVLTRLKLFLGEWWENRNLGFPMMQKVLGATNGRDTAAISAIFQNYILGTPYVTGLSDVAAAYDSAKQQFQFQAVVKTQFGDFVISTDDSPGSRITI